MANRNNHQQPKRQTPKVRLAKPNGRLYQLRYFCPNAKREVRISTGTGDETSALAKKKELEARLLLGIETPSKLRRQLGPQMLWHDFREAYRTVQLTTISESSAVHAESRLDLAERILSPRVLADVANAESLHRLQAELLAGAESRNCRPRSPHTVKSYVTSVIAALNWAHLQGWLEASPKIRKIKVSKLKKMKGRPITAAEFDQMLQVTPSIVGDDVAESWIHTLRGLWESALRLDELMHVSWTDPSMIQPVWPPEKLPVLHIPHSLQKNATEEEIPLLPGFEALLLETPTDQRAGWVFQPISRTMSQSKREIRPTAAWVGRVISRIGKKAGIVVCPGEARTAKPAKFASAHDLRRGCAERLLDAGVPPLVITRVLRHASWETTRRHYAPGDVQKDAAELHKIAKPNRG